MEITRADLLSLASIELQELLLRVDEETEDLLHYLLHDLIESVDIPDDLIPVSLRV